MQGQVDVLEGKAKVLARYRDGASRIADQLDALAQGEPIDAEAPDRRQPHLRLAWSGRGGAAAAAPDADDVHDLPPAVSRIVLSAQEDLRREIAREMHDGPAQSLTNIVLQAQIVDRLLARDPAAAAAEVRQLIVDGPGDAGRDEVVHLRRPPDGAGRPRVAADHPPRGARMGPTLPDPGGARIVRDGPAADDGARERAVPDHRRCRRRIPVRPAGAHHDQDGLDGRSRSARDGPSSGGTIGRVRGPAVGGFARRTTRRVPSSRGAVAKARALPWRVNPKPCRRRWPP